MSKNHFFSNIFKKISIFINSLLENKLNKLNFLFEKDKFLAFVSFKRFFTFLSILIVLAFSYLYLPNLHNKSKLSNIIKNQLTKNLNINFNLTDNFRYNLFPKPHLLFQEIKFSNQNKVFAEINEMKIFISLNNLFSLNDLKIKNIILNNVNFELNNKNFDFFIKLLNNNFSNSNFEIYDSNIFFRNIENDVLFINKINKLKYYYDLNDKRNTLISNNEIFNIPYTVELKNDLDEKKILSKFNFNFLKLQLKNELSYNDNEKNGYIKVVYNKNKSEGTYKLKKNIFSFNFSNNLVDDYFNYNGIINFIPFFSELSGDIEIINLDKLLSPNTILVQLFKSELLNNKNLNINATINAKQIIPFRDLNNLLFKLRIEDGLIDISETKFSWLNYLDLQIFDSLLYVKNNNLVLDGNVSINIHESNEIYKFFQTPANYRKEIKRISLNFIYNFDQEIATLNNIEVDGLINQKVNQILNQFISKNTVLQNRIYFKSLINKALKSYSG